MININDSFPAECAGRFRLERLLATGGYGAVFLATQVSLDRPVAIKLLDMRLIESAEQVKRFQMEARITATVAHPNIVRVIDHGMGSGQPWIAYEYVSGRTLRAIISAGPLPIEDAVNIVRQLASAIHAAHLVGVLHRDIKPENVIEAGPTHFKIADFGIAKWTSRDAVKTAAGMILGTPGYMAPERINGVGDSVLTDVYSLGVLLFELLTGRLPFTDSNIADQFSRQLRENPPAPRTLVPMIPPELDGIVLRALARDSSRRISNAQQMVDSLQSIQFEIRDGATAVFRRPPAARPATDTLVTTVRPGAAAALSTLSVSGGGHHGIRTAGLNTRIWFTFGGISLLILCSILSMRPAKPTPDMKRIFAEAQPIIARVWERTEKWGKLRDEIDQHRASPQQLSTVAAVEDSDFQQFVPILGKLPRTDSALAALPPLSVQQLVAIRVYAAITCARRCVLSDLLPARNATRDAAELDAQFSLLLDAANAYFDLYSRDRSFVDQNFAHLQYTLDLLGWTLSIYPPHNGAPGADNLYAAARRRWGVQQVSADRDRLARISLYCLHTRLRGGFISLRDPEVRQFVEDLSYTDLRATDGELTFYHILSILGTELLNWSDRKFSAGERDSMLQTLETDLVSTPSPNLSRIISARIQIQQDLLDCMNTVQAALDRKKLPRTAPLDLRILASRLQLLTCHNHATLWELQQLVKFERNAAHGVQFVTGAERVGLPLTDLDIVRYARAMSRPGWDEQKLIQALSDIPTLATEVLTAPTAAGAGEWLGDIIVLAHALSRRKLPSLLKAWNSTFRALEGSRSSPVRDFAAVLTGTMSPLPSLIPNGYVRLGPSKDALNRVFAVAPAVRASLVEVLHGFLLDFEH